MNATQLTSDIKMFGSDVPMNQSVGRNGRKTNMLLKSADCALPFLSASPLESNLFATSGKEVVTGSFELRN